LLSLNHLWVIVRSDGTGLYYYRARYYSPTLQRFLGEDPLGFYAGNFNLYNYVFNNPLKFNDPYGLLPGDPYPTQDAAGTDAINDINPASIKEGKEYGGWVYQNSDGTYSYTAPVPGTKDGLILPPRPPGKKTTGDYHTHGANDPGYKNEDFSNRDKSGNDATGTTGYLGTPSGKIKKYTPGGPPTDITAPGKKKEGGRK